MPAAAWGDAAVDRAVGAVPALRRLGSCAPVRQHARLGRPDRRDSPATTTCGTGLPVRRLARPGRAARRPGDARTDPALVATAYHAHSARLLARAAGVLGRDDDRERATTQLADRVAEAFNDEYVTANGPLTSDAQTALRYRAGVRPAARREPQRAQAAAPAGRARRADGYRIGTGFVGTPLICDALFGAGRRRRVPPAAAERVPVVAVSGDDGRDHDLGAWDSMLPDGTINPGEMTSFNHYALGAVADCLHRVVAGLAPAEPGYRKMLIRPRPGGGLTDAEATLRTPYGDRRALATGRATASSSTSSCPSEARHVSSCPAARSSRSDRALTSSTCEYRPAELDPAQPPRRSPFGDIEADRTNPPRIRPTNDHQ